MWDNKDPSFDGIFKLMLTIWVLGAICALGVGGFLLYILWGFAKSQGWV